MKIDGLDAFVITEVKKTFPNLSDDTDNCSEAEWDNFRLWMDLRNETIRSIVDVWMLDNGYKVYPKEHGRVYVEAEYEDDQYPENERTCQVCLVVYELKNLIFSDDDSGVHICSTCFGK